MQIRNSTIEDFDDSDYRRELASKLAQIHAMRPPLEKAPDFYFKTVEWYINRPMPNNDDEDMIAAIAEVNPKYLTTFDYQKEVNWIREMAKKYNSPIVFSHNDFQRGNILVRKNPLLHGNRLAMVDFEYSCANYRGYDFGYYFNQLMFQMGEIGEKPPTLIFENYPSVENRKQFISLYREAMAKIKGEKYLLKPENSIDSILEETKFGSVAASFLMLCLRTKGMIEDLPSGSLPKELDLSKIPKSMFVRGRDQAIEDYIKTKELMSL